MEFRLLGPVEVALDGEWHGLAASRQEIVLAMLLLDANRVVSRDRLIDALWDETPPLTAKTQVQISVSALRRLLVNPEGDADVILTRSLGYAIRIPDDALDLRRFEALVAKGTAAAGRQQPAEAARCLREALALWRGPAMAGVESRIVQVAATRWNETRLTVLEDCLDVELQLGRHHELIGELGELVAEQPLRERLRAQLMLALYRSGRQAEALETFRVGRKILGDELGLDPGDELRRLERAILLGDDSLNVQNANREEVSAGFAAAPAPRQLPAATADFTGREKLLAQVCSLLSPDRARDGVSSVAVVVLTGKGGVGKTTLALHAAHLLRESYPDGQLFAQLMRGDGQPESPAKLLERFLRSFGIVPPVLPNTLEDRAAMFRSWLAERPTLIVIDDAVSMSQVTPLLPGTPNCAVIITTRNRLSGLAGARHFEVSALDEQSGMELVTRVIGTDRAREEEEAVRKLVRLCDCLPLALRIAAAKLAARPHWRISQMLHRLEDEKRRLDELDLDGVSIRAMFSFSFESLDEEERRLLLRLSLLGAIDFASWVAAPLLDCDVRVAEELLEGLVEARLVEARVGAGGSVRYHLHDLVRIYAVERSVAEKPAAGRTRPLHRLLGCWLSLAAEAHRREYGGDFSVLHGRGERWPLPAETVNDLLDDPIGWFRSEHTALVAAIFQAGQAGLDELCWDLAMTSVTLFESGSHIDDWRKTHEHALTVTHDAGNRRGEAAMLYSLGTLALTGRLDDAARDLERAMQLFEDLGDLHGRALSLGGLAFIDRLSGRYDTALSRYRVALTGFQDAGDLIGEAHMLKDMAHIHMDWQHHDTAERLLDEALTACQKLGARRITAQIEYELADLYLRTGHLDRAEKLFGSARLIAHEGGDIVGQAYALLGLGTTRVKQEDLAAAERHLQAALELTEDAGDLLARGRVLFALAELDFLNDETGPALARLNDALCVLSELGSAAVWRARVLELIGRLHERNGRADAAEQVWRTAVELTGDTDPALAGRLTTALARIAAGTTGTSAAD